MARNFSDSAAIQNKTFFFLLRQKSTWNSTTHFLFSLLFASNWWPTHPGISKIVTYAILICSQYSPVPMAVTYTCKRKAIAFACCFNANLLSQKLWWDINFCWGFVRQCPTSFVVALWREHQTRRHPSASMWCVSCQPKDTRRSLVVIPTNLHKVQFKAGCVIIRVETTLPTWILLRSKCISASFFHMADGDSAKKQMQELFHLFRWVFFLQEFYCSEKTMRCDVAFQIWSPFCTDQPPSSSGWCMMDTQCLPLCLAKWPDSPPPPRPFSPPAEMPNETRVLGQ